MEQTLPEAGSMRARDESPNVFRADASRAETLNALSKAESNVMPPSDSRETAVLLDRPSPEMKGTGTKIVEKPVTMVTQDVVVTGTAPK